LLECLRSLPIQCLSKTRVLSMDMSSAYIKAANEFFGIRAQKIISIDHFHVAKLLIKAVDEIRKSDIKKLPRLERLKIHRNRYVWFRNGRNLPEHLQPDIEYQRDIMQDTAIAWTLKEKARDILHGYEPKTITSWTHWFRLVKESALRPLIAAADTIKKNLKGIMVAITTGTSNAKAEAINKTIKNLARISHGYRNKERYKNMIYLRLGKLDMCLDH
ncbi:MAG: transposase, partial [Oleibacter sp.]|nr:transposase [Thalassolituus sp.]